MSRYSRQFNVSGDPNAIFETARQYLISEGFEYINYEGENVFKKGVGFWVAPRFIKISFSSANSLFVEAWIKYALLPGVYVGEMDLNGFVGVAAKKPLKTIVDNTEAILMNIGCQPVMNGGAQLPPQQSAPAPTPQVQAPPQPVYQNTPAYSATVSQPAAPVAAGSQYAAPAPTPAAFCGNCGKPLKPGASFCGNCGNKVN